MKKKIKTVLTKLVFFVLVVLPSIGYSALFITPIEGEPFVDWNISGYVDVDLIENGIAMDWNGGDITYDGHTGIDFYLPDGFDQMEEGVAVFAAADGIVTDTQDGYYDGWSSDNPNVDDVDSNYIFLQHSDGSSSQYWHLKINSVMVEVGDQVSSGQVIGQVGSSGRSTGPHLHFEVLDASYNEVATYTDPDNWWIDPLPYRDDVTMLVASRLIHAPITSYDEDDTSLGIPTFDIGAGYDTSSVAFWFNYMGADTDDLFDLSLYDSNGDLYRNWETAGNSYVNKIFATSFALSEYVELGIWQAVLKLNGSTIARHDFQVIDSNNTAFRQEVSIISSCIGDTGRVDLNVVNTTGSAATYSLEFQGLSKRQISVEGNDWGRMPISGRPSGTYSVTVRRNNEILISSQLQVNCDDAIPFVSEPEVSIVNACRYGNGYVLFQLSNPTVVARPYIIEFSGVANRSTSAASFGQSVRGTSGRPDGIYSYTVLTGTTVLKSGQLEVDCD